MCTPVTRVLAAAAPLAPFWAVLGLRRRGCGRGGDSKNDQKISFFKITEEQGNVGPLRVLEPLKEHPWGKRLQHFQAAGWNGNQPHFNTPERNFI